MSSFPLPTGSGTVVVPAPASGPQNWAGAPSAAYDEDGSIVLAYRVRWAEGPTDANVIARSADADALFDARYLEILPLEGGGYRLYYEARLPDESHELRRETVLTGRS